MTKEEKQLLLKELCGRLPYGVKFTLSGDNIYTMKGIDLIVTDEGDWEYAVTAKGIEPIEIDFVKPYLRPISSLTDEECNTLFKILDINEEDGDWLKISDINVIRLFTENGKDFYEIANAMDYLYSIHVDFRDMIEKGIALEAPKDMYKTE